MNKLFSDVTFLTTNYNNFELSFACIKSLIRATGIDLSQILILDNSDKIALPSYVKNDFNVIDNSFHKITPNLNIPSKNHCSSIDYVLKNCIHTKYVCLFDNDVKFFKSINEFLSYRTNYDAIGEIGYDTVPPNRLFPYLCIIDVKKFKTEKLNYFDINRCIIPKRKTNEPIASIYGNVYDTGYSFLKDIEQHKWNVLDIKLNKYIKHYKAGSLKNQDELKKIYIDMSL